MSKDIHGILGLFGELGSLLFNHVDSDNEGSVDLGKLIVYVATLLKGSSIERLKRIVTFPHFSGIRHVGHLQKRKGRFDRLYRNHQITIQITR